MADGLLVLDVLDNPRAIERLGLSGLPLTAPATLRPCAMYADHGSARPSVAQGHHIYPVYLQNRKYGEIRHGDLMWLCGTCHDNTHAWLYWLMGERKQPDPIPPLRARAQALVAYDWFNA